MQVFHLASNTTTPQSHSYCGHLCLQLSTIILILQQQLLHQFLNVTFVMGKEIVPCLWINYVPLHVMLVRFVLLSTLRQTSDPVSLLLSNIVWVIFHNLFFSVKSEFIVRFCSPSVLVPVFKLINSIFWKYVSFLWPSQENILLSFYLPYFLYKRYFLACYGPVLVHYAFL